MTDRPDELDVSRPSHDRGATAVGATPAGGERRRGLRGPWRWGCGLLALLLALALAVAAVWFFNLDRTLKNNIVTEKLLPDEVGDDHTPDVPRDVDSDGDGKGDVNVDTDGDGKPDVNLDSDHDGKADYRIDADGDGTVDAKQPRVKATGDPQDEGDGRTPPADLGPDADGDGAVDGDTNLDGTVDAKDKGTDGAAPNPDKDGTADKPSEGASDTRNILLIGEDGVGAPYRSDVMILAHLSESGDKVTLVHFPRDLYVPIPGYGHNKLNAAYAFGGPQLLTRTFQGMLDVKIDDVAITDFENFKAVTNELGGVTVNNPQGSPEFPKGQLALENGDEALRYVRERKTLGLGDIGRGQRQMAYLSGMTNKAMSPSVASNPAKISDMVDAGTRGVRVSGGLSVGEIRSLAFDFVRGGKGDVSYQTAPWIGPGWSPSGSSIVVVDWPGMKALGESIRNGTL